LTKRARCGIIISKHFKKAGNARRKLLAYPNFSIFKHSETVRSICEFYYGRKGDTMEQKRFTKNDDSFICKNCGFEVKPLGYSSRNHCPKCLCSLHVDVNPGDRANECGGEMEPIAAKPDAKNGFVILHRCTKCGELHPNKAAYGANSGQMDSMKLLIALTARPWIER
jgi:hypothetical protein